MLPAGADRSDGETPFVPEPGEVPAPSFVRVANSMDGGAVFHGYRNEILIGDFTHAEGALDLSKVQLTIDGNPHPLLSLERPEPGGWRISARVKALSPGEHELRLRTARSGFSAPFTIVAENGV
jgi:hypothetical protein